MTVSFSTLAPDSTPPTVSVTAPTTGATVGNTVTVTADAADDVAVLGVQLLLDGAPLGVEDTVAPFSTGWDTTTATNGTHSLSARARDSVNQTTSTAVSVTVQNTDPRAVVGEWGPVTNWPIVPVHATLLHTGEILMWDGWELPIAQARLWNPATNTFTTVVADAGIFCAGQATDSEGRLVVMGGHNGGEIGIRNISVFDPVTRAWSRRPDMAYPRWYPSVTQLPDGRMITLSGQSSSGNWANTPEVYTPTTNTVSTLPITTPQLREGQYPQTAVLPSGKLLAISTEVGGVMTYDPSNGAWAQLGQTQVPYGVWTSFAPGKFLITGGGADFNAYNPSNPGPSQRQARVLDMTSGTPVWSDAGLMANARSFHNVTMLPTGKAIAIGGSTTVNDFSETGTLTAEMWDPPTNTWSPLASPARPRMYHSVSMLLPDGRVLSAGGGRLAPAPDQLNMQMYSPPYLFRGARPVITSAPSTIAHGSTMDLVSAQASTVAKVTLVDLASVTHSADWNQRFLELPFTRNGDTLTINTPANANLAPSNYYMVFIVDSNGVPSQAKIVKLGTPDTSAPALTGVQATAVTGTTASIVWNTDEPADGQVEYGTTSAYGMSTTIDTALATSHSRPLVGLSPGTLYHYRVKSRDGSGNLAISPDFTFITTALDTTPPTVSITAPAFGATVSGTIAVTVGATDNVVVAGVQIKVDGANVGAEDTTSPYSVNWATASSANGSHTITAVARDTSGNTATSVPVTVTVANTGAGPVAAYSFNEGSGVTLTDVSGSGNHGTVSQAAWTSAGKYGGALTFDGVNDYVGIPDSASLDLTTGMTLEAWVRPTATSGWRTIMLKESGGVELAYSMYGASGTNRPSGWTRTSGSSTSVTGTTAIALNTWTHLAVTYDGATRRIYINGVLNATNAASGAIAATPDPLKIGGNAVWGEYFAGQIDEMRIYNRALTQAQLQADMNMAS